MARTVREPFEKYSNPGGNVHCPCGDLLEFRQQVFTHWQLGHFDTVVNEPDIEERIAALEARVGGLESAYDPINRLRN